MIDLTLKQWKEPWLYKMKEKICIWLAWHMPVRLVYWCYLRVCSHATTGEHMNQVVPELTTQEASERWHYDHSL